MPGLVPDIHVFSSSREKTWMAGSSPAMTMQIYQTRVMSNCAFWPVP
jgi:hypothetical protein